MIEVRNVTKRFKGNNGVFDLSFRIMEGEVFGFLGPNGAGKSTTIRMLMGFMKPDSGALLIDGMDTFKNREKIQQKVGYIAGELALIPEMKGIEFLQTMAGIRKMESLDRMHELIDIFQLNPHVKISRMSKGMKQKVAIINALMHEPTVLILDEPTSGLDPLVQNIFLEQIKREKKRGATILMSSHSFTEVAKTCDTICIIKEGKIVDLDSLQEIQRNARQIYTVTFENHDDAVAFNTFYKGEIKGNVVIFYHQGETNQILDRINQYTIQHLIIENESLEEIFLHFYSKEEER